MTIIANNHPLNKDLINCPLEINIYYFTASSPKTALPKLLEKTLTEKSQHALLLLAEPRDLIEIDNWLWSYEQDSFLPHTILTETQHEASNPKNPLKPNSSPILYYSPILLQTAENFFAQPNQAPIINQAEYLFFLIPSLPEENAKAVLDKICMPLQQAEKLEISRAESLQKWVLLLDFTHVNELKDNMDNIDSTIASLKTHLAKLLPDENQSEPPNPLPILRRKIKKTTWQQNPEGKWQKS